MVIIDGWVRFAPGTAAAFREPAAAMIAASRAEEGCLEYAYAEDFGDPDLVRITEHWRDEAAVTFHFATPHMAAFMAALGEAERLGGDVRFYDAAETRRLI